MKSLIAPIGFLLALVAIAIGLSVFSSSPNSTATKSPDEILKPYLVDEAVKVVSVKDKDNKTLTLDETLPDKTLLTFWDATCGECAIALPLIDSFAKAHPEIHPLFINVKNTSEQADQALKKYNLSFVSLYDRDGSAFKAWSGTMPATYYIRGGRFKLFFPGRVSAEHLNALLTLN